MPEKRTQDYFRHGTKTLFAAMNPEDGTVIVSTHRSRRATEFKKFLAKMDKSVSRQLDAHVAGDNSGTHKRPSLNPSLGNHPRFHMHHTPAYRSSIHQVERLAAEVTRDLHQRSDHRGMQTLERDLRSCDGGSSSIYENSAEIYLVRGRRVYSFGAMLEDQIPSEWKASPVKAVTRLFHTSAVALTAVALTLAIGASPSSATEADEIDIEAVSRMHDALVELRANGEEVEGDISEKALIEELSTTEISVQTAPNGCSTPKALKKAAKKWNKLFKSACDTHDRCYGKYSKKNRNVCDVEFRSNMQKICKRQKSGKTSCYTVAVIYFEGVRAGGKKKYKGKGSNW